MGFLANLKGNKAYGLHSKKQYDEALKLYEEAYSEGMDVPRNLLAWISLLIRRGQYQKARDIIVKIQKLPGMTGEQKCQLFCNYAAVVAQLGQPEKGIAVLERMAAKTPTGLLYETLGYLYVVSLEHRPDENEPAPVRQIEAPAAKESGDDGEAQEDSGDEEPGEPEEPVLTPYQQWTANVEKARKFLDAAVDYDDEDSICLDNYAQFFYRVLGDKEQALIWFKKAIAIKESQIDTLWFLSRYDLENGDTASAVAKLKTCAGGNFSALNYVTKAQVEEEIRRLGGTPD